MIQLASSLSPSLLPACHLPSRHHHHRPCQRRRGHCHPHCRRARLIIFVANVSVVITFIVDVGAVVPVIRLYLRGGCVKTSWEQRVTLLYCVRAGVDGTSNLDHNRCVWRSRIRICFNQCSHYHW